MKALSDDHCASASSTGPILTDLLQIPFTLLTSRHPHELVDYLSECLKANHFYEAGKLLAQLCCYQRQNVQSIMAAVAHYFPLIQGQWLNTYHEAFTQFETGFNEQKQALAVSIKMFDTWFNGETQAQQHFEKMMETSLIAELEVLTTGLIQADCLLENER